MIHPCTSTTRTLARMHACMHARTHTHKVSENGAPLSGREKWNKSKILGSSLCSFSAHCTIGNSLLEAVDSWIKDSFEQKLNFYNATCVSLMLYNSTIAFNLLFTDVINILINLLNSTQVLMLFLYTLLYTSQ